MNSLALFVRNAAATVLTYKTELVCITGRKRVTFRLPEPHGSLLRVIELLRTPVTRADICAEIGTTENAADEILKLLLEKDVIVRASEQEVAASSRAAKHLCAHVVIGVSGSIYAAQVLPLAERIREVIAPEVEIILSEGAQRFVKAELFNYCGFPCWTDAYAIRKCGKGPSALHMQLATAADLIVVVPASARTVHRLAWGECSDLLSLVVSASSAPVVVAPSMNERMWNYPPITENIGRLRKMGMFCVEPARTGSAGSQSGDRPFAGAGLNERNIAVTLATALELSMHSNAPVQRILNRRECLGCEVQH